LTRVGAAPPDVAGDRASDGAEAGPMWSRRPQPPQSEPSCRRLGRATI